MGSGSRWNWKDTLLLFQETSQKEERKNNNFNANKTRILKYFVIWEGTRQKCGDAEVPGGASRSGRAQNWEPETIRDFSSSNVLLIVINFPTRPLLKINYFTTACLWFLFSLLLLSTWDWDHEGHETVK